MKVYQIEISNICNLTCSYCPHPTQTRTKGLMDIDIFKKSMDLLLMCGQKIAYLHNFGEPMLHPDLPEFIGYATTRGIETSFYTNGELLTEKLAKELIESGLHEICVSAHSAGQIDRIRGLLKSEDLSLKVTDTFRPSNHTNHNWAGQVFNKRVKKQYGNLNIEPCIFEKENMFVVLWDGRVNACCIDVNGCDSRYTIDDLLKENSRYKFMKISTCSKCDLMRGDENIG